MSVTTGLALLLLSSAFGADTNKSNRATPTANLPAETAGIQPDNEIFIANGSLVWVGPKRKDGKTLIPATVQNVVALLQELYPDANFILSPGAGPAPLADFKLRGANAEQVLQAICIASGNIVDWRMDGGASAIPQSEFGGGYGMGRGHPGAGGFIDPATGLPLPQPSTPVSRPMYVLFQNPTRVNSGSDLQVQAFSLSDYLTPQISPLNPDKREDFIKNEIKEIEKMIEETLQLHEALQRDAANKKSDYRFSIRFHRNALLLVLIGDAESVGVASKIVGALPGVKYSGSASPTGGMDGFLNPAPANNPFRGRYGEPARGPKSF